jgi:hypothetical protein
VANTRRCGQRFHIFSLLNYDLNMPKIKKTPLKSTSLRAEVKPRLSAKSPVAKSRAATARKAVVKVSKFHNLKHYPAPTTTLKIDSDTRKRMVAAMFAA